MIDSIVLTGLAVYWCLWPIGACWSVSVAATILQPWLAARRGTQRDKPPVSLVLPVKLLEQGFERTQESALAQNYPEFEVTVSAVERDVARRRGDARDLRAPSGAPIAHPAVDGAFRRESEGRQSVRAFHARRDMT